MGVTAPFDKQKLMVVLQRTPGVDICEVTKQHKLSSRIGLDNTFEIQLSDIGYCGARKGDIIDITGTEFGGIVKKVQHSNGKVILTGTTWRGLLEQHIIPPSVGTLSGDARYIIRTVLTQWLGASGLLRGAADSCGTNISGFNGTNKTILEALNTALSAAGLRLDIEYNGSYAVVDAVPVRDLSSEIELSQDYSADLYTSVSDLKFFNHCIAIGDGIRAEAWRKDDGTIVTSATNVPTGLACVDILIEHEKEDKVAKLTEKAVEKLEEGKSAISLEMDISERSELYLGDIVAAYDDITGISMTAPVEQIAITIQNGKIDIDYEVSKKDESN